MSRRATALVAAAAAVVLLAGCSGVTLNEMPAPNPVKGATNHFTADFTDVLDLTIGAAVKLNGAVVGAVTSISESDFVAHIAFNVQKKFALPDGTTAQIRFSTPLGDDYVALSGPASGVTGYLADGALLPITSTSAAPTIEDAFAALSLLLNQGGLDQIKTIADAIDTSLNGREGTVRDVLDKLQVLVHNLDQHKTDIDSALVSLNRFAVTVNEGNATIQQALDTFPTTIKVLADDTGKLTDLLNRVATLGTTVTGIVNQTQTSLISDLDSLKPSLDAVVANEGNLVPTVSALIDFGKKVAKAIPGDYLLADANITLLFGVTTAVTPQPSQYPHTDSGAVSQLMLGSQEDQHAEAAK